MRKLSIIWLALAIAFSLSACGGGDKSDPDRANGGDAGAVPGEADGQSGGQAETPDDGNQNPDSGITDPAPAAGLPPETKGIELEVEGMREVRTGTLAVSENGYYMYTLPLFVFTPEEPMTDQVYMETFPDYFMRIQPLGPVPDIEWARETAVDELKDLGEVVEWSGEQIYNPFIREHAVFHLHAVKTGEVTKYILLLENGGQYFRIMLHMPHGEASEGAGPSFEAMIGTITPLAE